MDLRDLDGQLLVQGGSHRLGGDGREPFVEAGTSDVEDPAQPGDTEGGAVFAR
ncbi:MAG: hypothetical protein M3443_00565 [Actinomycetota bacterium]|nr:hypothetical protein [Actinomycetota bacterium]